MSNTAGPTYIYTIQNITFCDTGFIWSRKCIGMLINWRPSLCITPPCILSKFTCNYCKNACSFRYIFYLRTPVIFINLRVKTKKQLALVVQKRITLACPPGIVSQIKYNYFSWRFFAFGFLVLNGFISLTLINCRQSICQRLVASWVTHTLEGVPYLNWTCVFWMFNK